MKKLHDEEMSTLPGPKSKASIPQTNKLTQAQIALARERINAQMSTLVPKKKNVQEQPEITENSNRITDDVIDARSVEAAIEALQ